MSRLVLHQLHARRLHGFRSRDRCLITGLGAGLNIVYAPNRAGKSTLALAYRLLIGDDLHKYRADGIAATWSGGEGEQEAVVEFGLRRHAPTQAALPMRYVLDLQDLVGGLSKQDKDATVQALAGNVKIPDLRPVGRGLRRGLEDLQKGNQNLREIERKAKEVEAHRRELHEVEISIERTMGADTDARWMRVRQMQLQLARMDGDHPGVESQSADALNYLDDYLSGLAKSKIEVEEVRRKLDAVAPVPGQTAPGLLRESDKSSIAAFLADYEKAITEGQHLTQELEGVRGALGVATEQLTTKIEADTVVPSAARFVDMADRARTLRCERLAYGRALQTAATRQEELMAALPATEAPDQTRQSLISLLTPPPTRPFPAVAVLLLLGLGGVASLLAALFAFSQAMVVMVAGIAAALLVLTALVLIRHSAAGAEKAAPADAIDPAVLLDKWVGLVRKDEEKKALERTWNFVEAWLRGKADTGPGADETEIEKAWTQWREAAGLPTEATPYHLAVLFERWQKTQDLARQAAALEAKAKEWDEAAAAAREKLTGLLQQYNWTCRSEGSPGAEVNAFREWFVHTQALREAEARQRSIEQRVEELLDRNGVPGGDLSIRQSILREREAVSRTRREWDNRFKNELHELQVGEIDEERIAKAVDRWSEGGTVDLSSAIGLALEAARGFQELRDRRNVLETSLRNFERETGMAEARLEYDRALAQLVIDGEAAQANAVWNTLIGAVREHVIRDSAPELLAAANAKLERVDAALTLRLAPPEFDPAKEELGLLLIDDRKNGRIGQRFSELATSTKVNAVLAIRLALIQASEQGVAYPVFADELMAVADETTRKGIAYLLRAEAADRQVIVLTNQAEDAHALLEAGSGGVNVVTIGHSGVSLPQGVELPPLPAYRVPPGPLEPDLEKEITAHAPAFLLVEESDLAAGGDAPSIAVAMERLSAERRAALEPVLEALREVHQFVARNTRRLRPAEIENQDWNTRAFQEQISRILHETCGDPEAFQQRVGSLRGYRDQNKAALAHFLAEKGLLGLPKPRLEDLVRRAREVLGPVPDATRTAQWCAMRYASFCQVPEIPPP